MPSIKDLRKVTIEVLKDLRELQRQGLTVPDVLYNYKIENGRLVRKRPRRGSFGESEGLFRAEEREQNRK